MLDSKRSMWTQAGYAATASFMIMSSGMAGGWSSNALLQLTSGELGFSITPAEGAWVVSFLNIGTICSCIHVRLMLDRIGRKKCLIFHGLPFAVGWTILLFSRNAWQLCIGRFLMGLGTGCNVVTVAYISEIAENKNRGPLTGLLSIGLITGLLSSFILGAFVSYHTAILVFFCLSVASFTIGGMILPETPYFLYMKSRNSEAEIALAKLRPGFTEEELKAESNHIHNIVKNDMVNGSTFTELFTNNLYRKSLIIYTVLKLFDAASGLGVVGIYIPTILLESGLSMEFSKMLNIAIGGVIIFAVCIVPLITAKVGRKPLLMGGYIGVAIGFVTLGMFFFMKDALILAKDVINEFRWLPILGLGIFSISACIALGPMLVAVESEIFPTNIKALAFVYGIAFSGLLNVCSIQFYQATVDAVSIYVPFWCFSVMLIGAMVFVAFCIPETKDKSFDDIQHLLNARNKLEKDTKL